MRGQRLLLRSVKLEESLVTDYIDAAMEIFKSNTAGPQKYLNTYKKYADLLNNKAEQEVTAFLKDSHSIEGFKQVCTSSLYISQLFVVVFCCSSWSIISAVWANIIKSTRPPLVPFFLTYSTGIYVPLAYYYCVIIFTNRFL